MKIGFFGGSFDPIHFGHINLAIELKERAGLDEVWFCPANISPHKGKEPLAGSLRLQIAKLAIEDIPGFKLIDHELRRSGSSYTVETLRELKKEFPEHEWFLILGDDCIENFFDWKEPNEILKLASPLIGSRDAKAFLEGDHSLQKQKDRFRAGWTRIPVLEISSTNIRDRLSRGLYCGHLLPAKVLDFITKNGLYS